MTDKFTEQYKHQIQLCKQMLILVGHSEHTKELRLSEARKLLLNFFPQDIISQATIKILYGEQ